MNGKNIHNVSDKNTSVYLKNDENVTDLFASNPNGPPWRNASWEEPLRQRLDPYIDGGKLDIESNQALVVYNYSIDEDDSSEKYYNRLAVLYEVGRSESEAKPPVGYIEVRNVDLEKE
jgi:hypothetical protein